MSKRLIDRLALFPNGVFFVNEKNPRESLDELINRIWSAPTVDAVEVVRCRDCKRFVDNKKARVTYCRRDLKDMTVNPNDFCSYGERK